MKKNYLLRTLGIVLLFLNSFAWSANANVKSHPQISQPAPLVADAGADKIICNGSSTIIGGTPSGGTAPYSYSWTPAGSLYLSTIQNPVAHPTTTTTYTLTVTDALGNTASDAVTVTVVSSSSLIANGNFEGSTPPLLRGQIENASSWTKATGDADLFDVNYSFCNLNVPPIPIINICGLNPLDYNCIGIPCNHFGYQDVRTTPSTKYAGLWAGIGAINAQTTAANVLWKGMVEGIETSFAPMTVGTTYRLTFYASYAENGEVLSLLKSSGAAFKIKLCQGLQTNNAFEPVVNANTDLIATGSVTDESNWVKYTYVFTVNKPYDHMIIESSADNLLTAIADIGTFNPSVNIDPDSLQSYFYIDDIKLKVDCEGDTVLIADAGPDWKFCKESGTTTTIGGNPTAIAGTPPYEYAWSPSGSSASNPTVTPTSTTTYTVTVTDANGLVATDDATVMVSDMYYDLGPSSITICSSTPKQIGNEATGGIPPYNYSWSPSTGLNNSSIAQPTATLTATTTYIATVTDAAGCIRKDTITVNVNQSPTVYGGVDKTVCNGSSVTLTGNNATGGLAPYFYVWYEVETGITYEYTQSITVSPSSTRHYVYFAEDARGCRGTGDTVLVTVSPKPVADAGPNKYKCSGGGGVSIGLPATGGTPPYTYSWSPATGLSSTTVASPTANPTSSTRYTVVVTDSKGCVSSSKVVVKVSPKPGANAGYGKTICLGQSVTLGGTHAAAGGTPPYTYSWSPGGMTAANPTVTPVTTTKYTLTVTDSRGCTATDTATIAIGSICGGDPGGGGGGTLCDIRANAGDSVRICDGASVTFGGSPTATGHGTPFTYSWTPAAMLSGATTSNPTLLAGQHFLQQIFTVIATNSCGIKSKDIMAINMNPPAADAGPDQTICAGNYAVIGNTDEPIDAYYPLTYSWTSSPAGGPYPTTRAISVNPTVTTTYTQRVTDGSGCVSTDVVVVTVNPGITGNAGPDKNICVGGTGTTIGTPISGGTGTLTIRWEPARGLSSQTVAQPTANPLVTTKYILTVTDTKGCTIKDEVYVYVNDAVYVNAGPDKTICKGYSTKIGYAASYGTAPYTYSWTPTTGLSDPTVLHPDASPGTTTTYTLTVTDSKGCQASDAVKVTVIPTPVANAGPDKAICYGKCTTIGTAATGGVGPYTYAWRPAAGLSSTSVPSPTACPTVNTTYIVTVTGSNGCFDEDTVDIQVFHSPEYIVNGTFENSQSPILRGQADYANGWYKATGTADLFDMYYNTCQLLLPGSLPKLCGISPLDFNCIGIPCNHYGYQEHINPTYLPSLPPGGTKYVGLWSGVGLHETLALNGNTVADVKVLVEGVGYKLDVPGGLRVGTNYTLCFWANKADKGEVHSNEPQVDALLDNLLVDDGHFKVKMSETQASNILFQPVDAPVLFSGTVSDSVNWVQYCYRFKATAPYKYVIIESDPGDKIQLMQNLTPGGGLGGSLGSFNTNTNTNGFQSYFYIDDISLVETCDSVPFLVAHAGPDTTICKGEHVTLGGTPAAEYGNPSPYTYVWTTIPASSFTYTGPHPVVSPTTTTTYLLTVTDGSGTVATDTVVVNVFNQSPYFFNGDFETVSAAPMLRGQVENATNWVKATGDADLFDMNYVNQVPCGLSPADYNNISIPCNHFGQQGINISGEHYVGLWAALSLENSIYTKGRITGIDQTVGGVKTINGNTDTTIQQSLLVEGIEIKLLNTLDVNRTYKLEFYASKAEKGETGSNVTIPDISPSIDKDHLLVDDCAGVNVKFSTGLATNILYQPVHRAIKASAVICDTINWVKVTYVFRPDSAYDHLILESFPTNGLRTGNGVTISSVNSGGISELINSGSTDIGVIDGKTHIGGIQSYVYLDDITLTEVCDVDVAYPQADAGQDTSLCAGSCTTIGGSPTAWNGYTPYTYSWSPATGLSSPTVANPIACPSSTTNYTLTVTDSHGHTATDNVTITVNSTFGERVNNGGFELASQPDNRGQIEYANGWIKGTGDADLFDKNASCPISCGSIADLTCVGIPCNHLGYQNHNGSNGRKYAGLWAASLGNDAFVTSISTPSINVKGVGTITAPIDVTIPNKLVEAIETELSSPLVIGHHYKITFRVSRAERGETNGILTSKIAKFNVKLYNGSTAIKSTIPFTPINLPVLYTDTVQDTVHWKNISVSFMATQASKYLIIESDIDAVSVSKTSIGSISVITLRDIIAGGTPVVNANINAESFFYIDDISLQEECVAPRPGMVSTNNDVASAPSEKRLGNNRVNLYPNPNTGNFVVSIVRESISEENPIEITVFNSMGQMIQQMKPVHLKDGINTFDMSLTDALTSSSANGIYFVRINNGKESIIEKVTVVKF